AGDERHPPQGPGQGVLATARGFHPLRVKREQALGRERKREIAASSMPIRTTRRAAPNSTHRHRAAAASTKPGSTNPKTLNQAGAGAAAVPSNASGWRAWL